MPAIDAPTVAEHRQRRHDALIAATCTILLNEGAAAVTMASVAARTGLSRTAIYEYYRSANDIVADVVVDEMLAWNDHLTAATADIADPGQRLEAWLRAALGYVTDGRHAIVRATADASLPPARRAQVRRLHQQLAAPIVSALTELHVAEPEQVAAFIWGTVDAATRRIEAGRASEDEVDAVVTFTFAGITAIA